MFKVVIVRAGQIPLVMSFPEIDDVFAAIKITKKKNGDWNVFETMELNNNEAPFTGIGIIAKDQDKPRLKKNLLGLKGDFIVLGMTRIEGEGNMHMFQGLTDEQIKDVRKGLVRAALFGGFMS